MIPRELPPSSRIVSAASRTVFARLVLVRPVTVRSPVWPDTDKAAALVVTMDDPAQVAKLVTMIRRLHPDLTVIARARDPNHAAELYRAGVTDAVPETLESSLQLSEAVLVDLGVAMGPVIASIHEKRAELRAKIMEMAETDREPPIWRRRLPDVINPPAEP